MPTYDHAYTFGFSLKGSESPDGEAVSAMQLRNAITEALTNISNEELLTNCAAPFDSFEEDMFTLPAPQVAKEYELQLGRDARQYFEATVTATLDQIKENVSRHGYADNSVPWYKANVDVFDNMEIFVITEAKTGNIVASYNDSDGWDPNL